MALAGTALPRETLKSFWMLHKHKQHLSWWSWTLSPTNCTQDKTPTEQMPISDLYFLLRNHVVSQTYEKNQKANDKLGKVGNVICHTPITRNIRSRLWDLKCIILQPLYAFRKTLNDRVYWYNQNCGGFDLQRIKYSIRDSIRITQVHRDVCIHIPNHEQGWWCWCLKKHLTVEYAKIIKKSMVRESSGCLNVVKLSSWKEAADWVWTLVRCK